MRSTPVFLLSMALCSGATGQETPRSATGPLIFSEDISLALNRPQVLSAAQEAWSVSFGQEPGARIVRVDAENGTLEGTARMNYRSQLLVSREETMGTVSYQVIVQAWNGQCHVRVYDLRHTGNRAARGGGLSAGPIMDGPAPEERYPGVSLGTSRRIHADIREAVTTRMMDLLHRFSGRMRQTVGQR